MLDTELRELERALRANPRDSALARRFLQALRRAGHVSLGPLGPLIETEPLANPGFAAGDLALVVRRAWPREAFQWLPEMEELLGVVAPVVRVHRDGLGAVLEVTPRRSFGFASLWRLDGS